MLCACAILSSVASPGVQYFSPLYHKRNDFRKRKFIEHKMCVLIFSLRLSSEIFLILRTERDMVKNVKYPLFLSDFNET